MIQDAAAPIERFLTLLSARQKLVSSNIANADTPGYKTKDVDFQIEFEKSLDPNWKPAVVDTPGLSARNDGNNVDMDRESRLLAENALRFNIASNLARAQLRTIRMAIEDGRSA
jgi:flagellar basal-body rod protein FlgB